MSDIIENLRTQDEVGLYGISDLPEGFHFFTWGDAADKIERLCEALKLILNANSLPYAQEIAAKALEEKKK